jgi:hypothetical protein
MDENECPDWWLVNYSLFCVHCKSINLLNSLASKPSTMSSRNWVRKYDSGHEKHNKKQSVEELIQSQKGAIDRFIRKESHFIFYTIAILKYVVLICHCIGVHELIVIRCSSFGTFFDLWLPTPSPRPRQGNLDFLLSTTSLSLIRIKGFPACSPSFFENQKVQYTIKGFFPSGRVMPWQDRSHPFEFNEYFSTKFIHIFSLQSWLRLHLIPKRFILNAEKSWNTHGECCLGSSNSIITGNQPFFGGHY